VQRQLQRMSLALPDATEVDFSGPTGGREGLDRGQVARALESLGLRRTIASTQIVPRDSWVHWFHTAAGFAGICEAIAEQYWLWAQSEISEVEVVNGAGSSAMPHKRGNPHRAENVMGLARLVRGMLAPMAESVVQRGDRDLAHNSVERVLLPDMAHLVATMLQRTVEIVSDYQIAPEYIEGNLVAALDAGIDSAIRTASLVREGYSRQDAITATRKEQK
jgi:adenylosuccinate lyase